jgi:hypothetical protein
MFEIAIILIFLSLFSITPTWDRIFFLMFFGTTLLWIAGLALSGTFIYSAKLISFIKEALQIFWGKWDEEIIGFTILLVLGILGFVMVLFLMSLGMWYYGGDFWYFFNNW